MSNLSHDELHRDAWLDLDSSGPRERQRVAGQLVASLEQAAVLLAGALSQPQQSAHSALQQEAGDQLQQAADFLKVSENVLLTIRSVAVALSAPGEPAARPARLGLPTAQSVLGTRWMGAEQRLALTLQASEELASSPADQQPGQMGKFRLCKS